MNRFVHRIIKASTASSLDNLGSKAARRPSTLPAVHQLVRQDLRHAKLLYFGEFHGESRIVSFQTELVKEWARCLNSAGTAAKPTRLHLIMEHFSVDMQSILDRYVGAEDNREQPYLEDDDEAFEELIRSYKDDFGTEGHDLRPYRDLLQFCRDTMKTGIDDGGFCSVGIHGGFIPRTHAARLNKECPDLESKKLFFNEMSQRGYLPKHGEAMHNALFEDDEAGSSFKLRGSPEHQLSIESLMSGHDLYSPADGNAHSAEEHDEKEEETPMSRLYQAQLLKDHAMGFRVASLMLEHYEAGGAGLHSDRYVVIAGFGHLKHRLGVPACVTAYLRQEALMHSNEHRRAAALDLLLSIAERPPSCTESRIHHQKLGGKGSALIGCQMMYEAYLEDSYPPMISAVKDAEGEEDDDAVEQMKKKLLKDVYCQNPSLLDEYILQSQEVSGPLLQYANGIAGFQHPCADYLFIYDEDDDNIIEQADLENIKESKCPFSDKGGEQTKDAKQETFEAYQQVGETACLKGNVARARAIMLQIGYAESDMEYVGEGDLYNFQGVANPHIVAKVQPGEAVLDVGSGLGIDSFLALRDCGADSKNQPASDGTMSAPFVVGVDLAESEVRHASKRAIERGYNVPHRIQFIRGDVEQLDGELAEKGLPMETFDVCISNGAFCLVPDKAKAFTNVFNALKPGGRMAISTTTIVSDHLDPSFEWPVCMRMFASLESIKPMCERIGFETVQIIDAESPMEGMEVPMDDEGSNNNDGQRRFKIHGKYADQYSFLEKFDMDELCKVVTVYGVKPRR